MTSPGRRAPTVTDPLGLDVETFRALGHLVVDRVADHWASVDAGPVVREAGRSELDHLGGALPVSESEVGELVNLLVDQGLSNMQHAAHPRYFARVPSPTSFTGILGDWLGVGLNAIASSWAGGSGPSELELVVVDWIRQLMGLPDGTEGLLVSGGSLGNITALAAARSAGYDGPTFLSDQTHSSILRGLRVLRTDGYPVRVVPVGQEFRWDAETLATAIDREGASRGVVIATAGTTNTGAVDPLATIAEICAERDLWLHVDGAYGAPARLTERGRTLLAGIERADSLTLDPHKWLFQPYDLGCVLVTRPGVLEACYAMNPEYLRDVQTDAHGTVDLRNRGLELTRRARAVKLWLTFRAHGVGALARAIDRSLDLADQVENVLAESSFWEVVTPAQLGVITFAAPSLTASEHRARARALTDSGFAAVSCTELAGRTVFRLCLINPRTTLDDVVQTLYRLQTPNSS